MKNLKELSEDLGTELEKGNKLFNKAKKVQLEVVKKYTDADIEAEAPKVGGKRNLREVVVTTDDGYEFWYLVKKPNRSVLQAIAEYEQKKNIQAIEKLMYGLVLHGDKEALEHDGAIYTKVMEEIGRLVQSAKSTAKNV